MWSQLDAAASDFDIWASRYSVSTNSWSAAVRIETNVGFAMAPQIAIGANGDGLAVWQQSDGTRDNIWANRYTAASNSWGSATLLETDNTDHARDPQVVIDANGNGLAVWKQNVGTPRVIWGNRYTAATGTWAATAALVDVSTRVGSVSTPHLAIAANGNALAVWSMGGEALANRYTVGTGWGTVEVIGNGDGAEIAGDAATGNAVAVFTLSGNLWSNRYTTATGWGTATQVRFNGVSVGISQVALDATGNALAVWVEAGRIWSNRYTAGSGWGPFSAIIQTDISGGSTALAQKPRLAMDPSGNALAVWVQSDGSSDATLDIWANRYTAATNTWGTTTSLGQVRINTPGADGFNAGAPQIAFDGNGNAMAVWTQPDGASTAESIWFNRYR